MDFIIMPTCGQRDLLLLCEPFMRFYFESVLTQYSITTVEKVVIVDSTKYLESIIEIAHDIDPDISVTNDADFQGLAIVISGFRGEEFAQMIFFQDRIFVGVLCNMFNNPELEDFLANKEIITFISDECGPDRLIHEVGHALHNQLLLENYNYVEGREPLQGPEVSVIRKGLVLWSEYFAERLACQITQNPKPSCISNLVDHITSLLDISKEPINHPYRTLYLLAHYTAFYHEKSIPIPLFEDGPYGDLRDEYIKPFKSVTNYWKLIHSRIGKFDFAQICQALADTYLCIAYLEEKLYIGRPGS